MSSGFALLLAGLLVGMPLIPWALTLYNLRTWRRPELRPADETAAPRVSVLIPARNEEARLGGALSSVLAQGAVVQEVVVYSDGSTDGTEDLVQRIAARDGRIRLLRGEGLPEGWVGKPHACQRLLEHARGPLLLFMDADVRLRPGAVSALVQELERGDAQGLLTAVPLQEAETFFEKLILPLLSLTYTSWLPLRWAESWSDPRAVAANGQLLLLARPVAEALGGFGGVAAEIVDDVALARLAKRKGVRVLFVDASSIATCRMYDGARAVWRGFSKNLYEGLGSPLALAVALGLYLGCFVLPYLALGALSLSAGQSIFLRSVAAGGDASVLWGASALGAFLNVSLRAALALRYRHPWWTVVVHPLAILLLCALALRSFALASRGQLVWAGRTYASRGDRQVDLRSPAGSHPQELSP